LEGTEEEAGGWRKEVRWVEEAGEIEEKEIKDIVRKIKNKKAAGIDGISMEAWKYVSRKLKEEMMDLIKTIWQ